MERDKIIKALECCIEGECDGCTYDEQTACKEYLLHDALTLINSQEQRIKELTEVVERSETARGRKESIDNGFSPSVTELQRENERLRAEVSVKRKLLNKAEVRIECVEEENNQLKADICNAEMNLGHITEDSKAKDETITNLIETIKSIQADTVRKMQNLIAQKIGTYTKESYVYVHAWFKLIDQIAKEMLEGNNDNNRKSH